MASTSSTIMTQPALADIFFTGKRISALARDIMLVTVGSMVVALSAQIEIRLPFTVVPLTGQTFGVLLVGMCLGWRRGAIVMMLYLTEGAIGMPVFSGGSGGAAKLMGPTLGYLVSFPVSAAVAGLLAQRGWDRSGARTFAAMLIASIPTLLIGTLVLSFYVGGLLSAFRMGLFPFLPGDVLKAGAAAILMPTAWKYVGSGKSWTSK